jgi:ribonuclease HII
VQAISAASILAKVERDRILVEYHQHYPDFSFHQHKGYGTQQHVAEIEQFGFLSVHRKSFNPVRTLIAQAEIAAFALSSSD